ncbi:flavodoxin FldA [Dongshaea marina]|uniref:flavodoxin FldA n=1 Tax=Dongshaea marina TaxID=2047966 RepID=UPI000D3E59A2|nr:flavodoxin FldA [Dongshaea marina]
MAKIGLFFGSDTGNTEAVAELIQKEFDDSVVEIHDIAKSTKADIEQFDTLIFGIPTWYYGEAQADWDDFFPELENIDFTGKTAAIFGCGDQEDYAEYFLDAMGTLRDIIEPRGAKIVGHWSTDSYEFEESKAKISDDMFVGLGIDEDRQPELTQSRITSWCTQLKQEMGL